MYHDRSGYSQKFLALFLLWNSCRMWKYQRQSGGSGYRSKNDPAGAITIKLLEDINSYDAALLKQLAIAATRNEGKHLFFTGAPR